MIAESYERTTKPGGMECRRSLPRDRAANPLTGQEFFSITGIPEAVDSTGKTRATVTAALNGSSKKFEAIVRIDTPQEAEYYRSGGILPYVLRQLAGRPATV